MKPNFEPAEENHEFTVGEEVYLIDNNKIDIFKAKIDKVNKKGFSVSLTDYTEGGPKKVLSPKRLLLQTPANNEIYEQQQQLRKKSEEDLKEEKKEEELKEDMKEEEVKNEGENDGDKKEEENESEKAEKQAIQEKINEIQTKSSFKKVKRRRKMKKPLFDQQTIIKTAWHNGIHEATQFKKYLKRNVKLLVSEFEKYQVMMNVADEPPFSIGINLEDSQITKFWTMARNQWKKLFDDAESVKTEEFIKKTASTYKLQNQMESNAKEALRFFFDTENGSSNETNFFQFCALLALFGPTQTMFRKIGHFFQCPPCLKDSFAYNDVNDITEPDPNICLNEFVFFAGSSNEKIVYNLPFTTTDKQYIVDEEGNHYDSWLKVYEEVLSVKVEEETTTINSPPAIPIEAS